MEKSKPIKVDLPMKLLDVSLDEFVVKSKLPVKFSDTGLDNEQVQFEFNLSLNINPEKELITVKLTINYFAEKKKISPLGHQSSTGKFEIKNLAESINAFKGNLPNTFLASLIGILISTSRGFLILKTKGTIMQGMLIPPINPLTFFPVQTKKK